MLVANLTQRGISRELIGVGQSGTGLEGIGEGGQSIGEKRLVGRSGSEGVGEGVGAIPSVLEFSSSVLLSSSVENCVSLDLRVVFSSEGGWVHVL